MKNLMPYPVQEPERPRHTSFLLRLWQVDGSGTTAWQASLEIPGTGERVGFANLETLFAFLMAIAEGDSHAAAQAGSPNAASQDLSK